MVNKHMFGYNQHGKFYRGLLQKTGGERLGKGCVVVPTEHSPIFHELFKKNKITTKIKKVVDYS